MTARMNETERGLTPAKLARARAREAAHKAARSLNDALERARFGHAYPTSTEAAALAVAAFDTLRILGDANEAVRVEAKLERAEREAREDA